MRAVEKDSTAHLVTGVLRVLCRGVCTSSRLHTRVVGRAYGCDRAVGDDDRMTTVVTTVNARG